MSDINREVLEAQAKEAICSCWYYDLCDGIDSIEDEILHKIIEMPMYSHLQAQIKNPVPLNDFKVVRHD